MSGKGRIEPSGSLLGRTFSDTFTYQGKQYVISAHGPYINTGLIESHPPDSDSDNDSEDDCEDPLCSGLNNCFVELNVFHSVPKTIRGVILAIEDNFVLVYGDDSIALVSISKLLGGGLVCHSRIFSPFRFVIGGFRVAARLVRIFFADGTIEDLTFTFERKSVSITRGKTRRVAFESGCPSAVLRHNKMELVASTLGEVLDTVTGKILPQVNHRSAVCSMKSVGASCIVLLFADGAIGSLDVEGTAKMSLREGRFSSIAVTGAAHVVAGDYDGYVYKFTRKLRGKLFWESRSHVGVTGELSTLLPLSFKDKKYLFVGSRLGSFHCLDWTSTEVAMSEERQSDFMFFLNVSGPGFRSFVVAPSAIYILREGQVHRYERYVMMRGGQLVHKIQFPGPAYKLRSQIYLNQQVVYAYGQKCYWVNKTVTHEDNVFESNLMGTTDTDILAVLQLIPDHFIVQSRSQIELMKYAKDEAKLRTLLKLPRGQTRTTNCKLTAATHSSPLRSTTCVIVVGDSDGNVYYARIDWNSKENKLSRLEGVSAATSGQRVVSIVVGELANLFLLTERGRVLRMQLMSDTVQYQSERGLSRVEERTRFVLLNSSDYGKYVGCAYEILIKYVRHIIVGFKQGEVIFFDFINEQELFRVDVMSPRRNWHVGFGDENNVLNFYSEWERLIGMESVRVPHKPLRPFRSSLRGPATAAVVLNRLSPAAVLFGDSQGYVSMYIWRKDRMEFTDVRREKAGSVVTCMTEQMDGLGGYIVLVGTSAGTFSILSIGAQSYQIIMEIGVAPGSDGAALRDISFLSPIPANLSEPCLVATCTAGNSVSVFSLRFEKDASQTALQMTSTDRVATFKNFKTDLLSCKGMKLVKDSISLLLLDSQGYLSNFELKRKAARISEKDINRIEKPSYSCIQTGSFPSAYDADNFVICGGLDGSMLICMYTEKTGRFVFANSDTFHTCPVVAISYEKERLSANWEDDRYRLSICSLDGTGLVVYRRMVFRNRQLTADRKPHLYYSCVPRPRTVHKLYGSKEIIVAGEGIQVIPIARG